ncbi:MAG: ATP-dependent zinc metalloprotease FtsH [Chloroflexota bacterium]
MKNRVTNPRSMLGSWRTWLVVAVILLVCNVVAAAVNNATQHQTPIAYSQFETQVEAANVPSVVLDGHTITGSLKTTTSLPTANGKGTADVSEFSTQVPAFGDPSLLPLLREKNVQVTVKPPNGNSSLLLNLAISFLPILLLVGFMFFMTRRIGAGQDQIFSFGQARARLYNKEQPAVTFSDVAGVETAQQELEEIVDFLRDPQKFGRLGGKMPKGILLAGPPGTGKTLLARAVAGEAHVPFFNLSGSEFVEMLVGVGASRVRDLFAKAKAAAPAIIFVDELDAVGRQRGAGLGGGHDEREQTLNQLLVEMDGFDPRLAVIVMAATNRPDVLDPALLRPGRFDRTVTLDRPDRNGREGILRIHTRNVPLGPDVDLMVLARSTPGLVGADLANVVNEAAIIAVRRGADFVQMPDFEHATDKVLIGPERKLLMVPEERRLVAYHEGGHALVALLLPKADPVHKVSIVPHGQALGVTLQMPLDDRHNYPEDYLLARMAVMLGGRLAEEIVFRVPTSGAENDLMQVTRLARQMIARWGMSAKVGQLAYSVAQEHPFLGRDIASERDFSEKTAALIDDEMRLLVDSIYGRTRVLLLEHRPQLDRLADALLEQETLDGRQLGELLDLHVLPVGS